MLASVPAIRSHLMLLSDTCTCSHPVVGIWTHCCDRKDMEVLDVTLLPGLVHVNTQRHCCDRKDMEVLDVTLLPGLVHVNTQRHCCDRKTWRC